MKSSLWKTSVERDIPSPSTHLIDLGGISEMSETHDDPIRAPVNDIDAQDVGLRDLNAKHVVEDGKDVHLDDRYGSGDQETWRPPSTDHSTRDHPPQTRELETKISDCESQDPVRLVNEQQVTQETDGDTCDQISRGARSRNVSPRKRLAGQMRAEEPEDVDDINDQYERNSKSHRRGRKRRWSSYSHLVRRHDSCTPSGQELHRSGSELSESTGAAILDDLHE